MRIAVDMDGTIYCWQRTVCYMMREYRGATIPAGLEWWTSWDSHKEFTTSDDNKWLWKEGVELGLFRYGHMVKGARRGLEALRDDGHTFIIATSRPENATSDTIDWLSLYFKGIPLAGIVIGNEPKRTIKADLLIDDRVENVVDWKAGRPAILFDQPWNREAPDSIGVHRAKGWGETIAKVREVEAGIEAKKLTYQKLGR